MNANYIYKVFETAEKNGSDLTIALEILRSTDPIPDGLTKSDINAFIGLHENILSRAYRTYHPKLFADIVAACVKNNDDEADLLMRAYGTGNKKLIEELAAKYGGADHV